MPPQSRLCAVCKTKRPSVKRSASGAYVCKDCFFFAFEEEVHALISENKLLCPGDRVAIAVSGGKDSTVLAHVIVTLNERHNYGLDMFLLSVDEGIIGYRDGSLETVKKNQEVYGIPLHIVSFKEAFGWSMDEIVLASGGKSNCTFCGVFRRRALDVAAERLRADKVLTGHNADDLAETILMNFCRGDIGRLERCASVVTGDLEGDRPRLKPLKYCFEKEIVLYAHLKRLDYFCTECTYAPTAFRGFAREFVKNLEVKKPSFILETIRSAEKLHFQLKRRKAPVKQTCESCGSMCSMKRCKACELLAGLNAGRPTVDVGSKADEKE